MYDFIYPKIEKELLTPHAPKVLLEKNYELTGIKLV